MYEENMLTLNDDSESFYSLLWRSFSLEIIQESWTFKAYIIIFLHRKKVSRIVFLNRLSRCMRKFYLFEYYLFTNAIYFFNKLAFFSYNVNTLDWVKCI